MNKIKFIGHINVGYGPMYQIIEAASEKDAREELYNWWLQECEDQTERDLEPYTSEKAYGYSLED